MREKTEREKKLLYSFLLSLSLYVLGWVLGLFEGTVISQAILLSTLEGHLRTNVSAWYYISHNLSVEGILVLSACLPFLGPGSILLVNGFLAGTSAVLIATKYGLPFLLVGLLPHGIPEMLAWIITGAVGFLLSQKS